MAKDTVIAVDQLFSKGFVRDDGTNKIPEYFADEAINVRIVNGWIKIRNWHIERYSDTGVLTPWGITGNETRNKLLFVYNWTVYDINTSTRTATSLWSIGSTARCRFINYGSHTIFLTWDQRPYWYSWQSILTRSAWFVASNVINLKVNWVAMTPVTYATSSAATLTAIAAQILTDFPTVVQASAVDITINKIIITPKIGVDVDVTDIVVTLWASQPTGTTSKLIQVTSNELDLWVNPSFWGTFAWFTMINRNDTTNVLSISRPIWLTTQGYCKDWKGTDAYTISFKWQLQGMCATLSRFWVFTDKSIEFLSPSFLDSAGAYVPTTFADWEQLCSPDCVVAAWDIVFFVTKNKRIRSIWYQWSVTEPQIKTITDIENSWIQRFMDEELAEDQSLAFWHYDRFNNLVKFFFVWINSNTPDTCLCRDINASQRLQDMDKTYWSICTLWTNQYASSAVWQSIYQDEVGEDDDWQPIQRSFVTQAMWLSEPSLVKFWRWVTIAGQIGFETLCRTQIYVDDILYFDKYIDWSIENPFGVGGVGDSWIWFGSIGDVINNQSLSDFEKVVDLGRLRRTGKKIRFSFSWSTIWQRIVLDFLSIVYRVRTRRRVKDKRFTSLS